MSGAAREELRWRARLLWVLRHPLVYFDRQWGFSPWLTVAVGLVWTTLMVFFGWAFAPLV
ncbi:hypothetical protein ACN20G_33335 (plasmid) [Streptomyces sp. BI20]|uniref:hypothetical protein n=1 Tax=Streptomyces sp. BI20 TaxID=3403460 RepID=UPI003C79317D